MDTTDNENRLSFLLTGSCNSLPSSYLKLRSYLNIYSSYLANIHGLKLPKSLTNKNITCPHCYIPWGSNNISLKLVRRKKFGPGKKKKNKGGSLEISGEESSDQLKNKLVIKCKFCTSRSAFSLQKPAQAEEKVEEVEIVTKKKKKKKDKTCGLFVNLKTPSKDQSSQGNNKLNNNKKNKKSVISNLPNPSKGTPRNNTVKNPQSEPSDSDRQTKLKPQTKFMINPYALQTQNKNSKTQRKNREKLKKLQNAIKEDKGQVKKSLKDFLTLI